MYRLIVFNVMRTMYIKFTDNQNLVSITDWNFKTWKLSKNVNQMYECSEIKGCAFISTKDFVTQVYGKDIIYHESNRFDKFVNYETIVE